MPLARSREGRVTCCSCQLDVVNAPDGVPSTGSGSGTDSDTQAPATNAADVHQSDTRQNRSEEERPAESSPTHVVAVRSGPSTRTSGSLSAALGEKLLQGWTMVNRACTTCATPLLRSSSGALLCVSCAGGASSAQAQNQNDTLHTGRSLPGPNARPRLPQAPVAAHAQLPQFVPSGEGNSAVGTVEEELRCTEMAAVQTLRSLRESLVTTGDVERLRSIVKALRETVELIEAVQRARRALL